MPPGQTHHECRPSCGPRAPPVLGRARWWEAAGWHPRARQAASAREPAAPAEALGTPAGQRHLAPPGRHRMDAAAAAGLAQRWALRLRRPLHAAAWEACAAARRAELKHASSAAGRSYCVHQPGCPYLSLLAREAASCVAPMACSASAIFLRHAWTPACWHRISAVREALTAAEMLLACAPPLTALLVPFAYSMEVHVYVREGRNCSLEPGAYIGHC